MFLLFPGINRISDQWQLKYFTIFLDLQVSLLLKSRWHTLALWPGFRWTCFWCINLKVIYCFYKLIFSWLVNYGITWFLGFRKPRTKISRMWSQWWNYERNLFLSQRIYLIYYYNYFTNYNFFLLFSTYAGCDFF